MKTIYSNWLSIMTDDRMTVIFSNYLSIMTDVSMTVFFFIDRSWQMTVWQFFFNHLFYHVRWQYDSFIFKLTIYYDRWQYDGFFSYYRSIMTDYIMTAFFHIISRLWQMTVWQSFFSNCKYLYYDRCQYYSYISTLTI